jgi:hypothetical protein
MVNYTMTGDLMDNPMMLAGIAFAAYYFLVMKKDARNA